MAVTARHGFGTTLSVDLGGGAVTVGLVRNVSEDGHSVDLVSASHHGSPNARHEKLPGIVRGAELTIELLYDPHDDGTDEIHEDILAAIDSRLDGANIPDWVVTLPGGFTRSFAGRPIKFVRGIPFDDVMTATLTVKVAGAITQG